jgi:signal transduction histidine kinase
LKLKVKKRILFFLIVPSLLIIVSIFYLNRFNKEQLKEKFAEITLAEGVTIRNLVEVSGFHLAEEGEKQLIAFLDRLFDNESIVYIGLFKKKQLLYLLSRFEGFFPVTPGQEGFRIFDTPAGKIFGISGQFPGPAESRYRLYLGFNYEFLSTFESAASRNFLIVAGLFSLVILFIIALIVYFDRRFFRKELELLEEKQQKERFQELSLLTAEIAHEIKNPLNSIYLSFNVLEKYCASDRDASFYRDAIKGEIQRVSRILQDYTELSREIRPRIQEVLITDFSDEFRLLMEEELKTRQVELEVTQAGKERFKTDKNLLKQVVLNLVKNALEADATRITIAFRVSVEALEVDVTDNGKGIAEALKTTIFKPYMSTKTKGMGLGLHITRRLVQALNGNLELISHEPGNTLFRVWLPGGIHRSTG